MKARFFDKLENKVFMIIVLTALATGAAVFTITYSFFYALLIDDMRSRTEIVNQYTESSIDPASFAVLNRREDAANPLYDEVGDLLNRVRRVANVRYLYTAKALSDGTLIYLIDGLDRDAEDFRYIGDPIEPEVRPVLRTCLSGEHVDSGDILNTDWGPIFSTCWPVLQNGTVIGAVMMEFDAGNIYNRNIRTVVGSITISALIATLFILIARLFLKRVSEPFYKKLAYTDGLTGLNNRTAFELDLKELETRPERRDAVTLVVYDLNRLKEMNDQYGHAAGDAFIKKMAGLIREFAPGGRGRHYRIGGDEFATVLVDRNEDEVRAALDRLFARNHNAVPGRNYFEFSYGVASFELDRDRTLHDLLSRADAAMYRLKSELKGGAVPREASSR